MSIPNFPQQWDKLTEAYIKNEVDPHNNCACFVGNLLDGNEIWGACRDIAIDSDSNPNTAVVSLFDAAWMKKTLATQGYSFYTPTDIRDLEYIFLNTYYQNGGSYSDSADEEEVKAYQDEPDPEYEVTPINENALFIAFEKTLDLLKQIHIKNGEVIDEVKPFIKRKLTPNGITL